MTYAQSIEFLYGLRLFGFKPGLENTRKLAALAGDPQDRLRFIHIAGTNGKGSVAAMLESVYRAAGLRVGLYTSPHLVSFRERIQVDRHMISEADVVRLVTELKDRRRTDFQPVAKSTSSLVKSGQLEPGAVTTRSEKDDRQNACSTFFEFVTVTALRYFAEQQCDLVIWETGLGGRLDATNIVVPLASVITNIEPDHQHWLGHDLKSIASEKAGIIKKGVPTLTATSEPEGLAVIQETALARQSPLTLVTPVHTSHPPLDHLHLPLPGWHQRMNAAVALAAVQALQAELPVSTGAMRSGLENVRWAGRLQFIERGVTRGTGLSPVGPQRPQRILLDGAHNASGATSLRAVLEKDFPQTRPTLILGILQDKDWGIMCEVLAPVADRILCVPVKSERGADPHQLGKACRWTNRTAEIGVMDSVGAALEAVDSAPLVVVAGSLYLIGEALEALDSETPPDTNERGLNEWVVPPPIDHGHPL